MSDERMLLTNRCRNPCTLMAANQRCDGSMDGTTALRVVAKLIADDARSKRCIFRCVPAASLGMADKSTLKTLRLSND